MNNHFSEGSKSFTPREIVSELDRYIIGQHKAKRSVAIALRNRWRRQQVTPDLRDEIAPKNIIMIGATGVGKTEIARRLAKLAHAPFIKVEASKFTEVGYVGRDVESMIRDLVELAIQMVKQEDIDSVEPRAEAQAYEQLARMVAAKRASDKQETINQETNQTSSTPGNEGTATGTGSASTAASPENPLGALPNIFGPFLVNALQGQGPHQGQGAPGSGPQNPFHQGKQDLKIDPETVAKVQVELRSGKLDNELIELDVPGAPPPFMTVLGVQGGEEVEHGLKDMFSQLGGNRSQTKKLKVEDALRILKKQEAEKLIDLENVHKKAIARTEQNGIVFLDEVDKVAKRERGGGPDVSREGVQRDLLPIIEGSTVNTKYGPVKTDHILFIAAGAFHLSKVSDLIPELQGRFPIRVELESLRKEDLVRILKEPKNALTKQYHALLATEGIDLDFGEDAIEALAAYASDANERAENIGARRLHTVMEALLDELSFTAPERRGEKVKVDAGFVHKVLSPISQNEDSAKYIL